jgi:hypothetical protein
MTSGRENLNRRRRGPPCRKFTLLDGMILIVVAAVGFAGYRSGLELASEWFYRIQMCVEAFLLLASWLVLIYRFRRPRPSIRHMTRQPGAMACFAIVAMQVVQVVQSLLAHQANQNHAFVADVGLMIWFTLSEFGDSMAAVVPICWILLVAARRWRSEPGWIDALGRWIGWAWIAWLVIWPFLYWLAVREQVSALGGFMS